MTCIAKLSVPHDRRPPGASVSPEARTFVFDMERRGFRFELAGGRVRVRPGDRVTQAQRVVLRGCFHEIRQLLTEAERPH